VFFTIVPQIPEDLGKLFLPGVRADFMGGKRDKIGGYPEKEEPVLCIILEDLL
jgi:hypothetical protein